MDRVDEEGGEGDMEKTGEGAGCSRKRGVVASAFSSLSLRGEWAERDFKERKTDREILQRKKTRLLRIFAEDIQTSLRIWHS